MAYEIISQNNNTTTLSDGVNTITVPSRVNLTSGNFTIVEVNNNMATLEDGDGNVYRDIPCVATLAGEGGGGSSLPDQTGHSGEFLTTDGTDASWAAVDALPDQTGHSGEFLTTDGTSPSWSDKPLQNTATSEEALTILGTPSTLAAQKRSINIGSGSSVADSESVVIGRNATSSSAKTVSVGAGSQTNGIYTVAIGANAKTQATPSIAIGYGATASAVGAIMIGSNTNSEANTVKINSYKVLDSDGTIPTARLTNAINKYSSMPTAGADYLGQIAQFTGTTDANYTHGYIYECVSDGGNPATYSWTAVSVQAGGSSLPSQTGNSGKFLTTDGTDASWSNTVDYIMKIKGNSYDVMFANSGPSFGVYRTPVGSTSYNNPIFYYEFSTGDIQFMSAGLGTIGANGHMPKTIVTQNISRNNQGGSDTSWLISVPQVAGELAVKQVNTTITIAVADWNGGTTVTKTVSGITATGIVFVAPDPTDQAAYTSAGILCTAQAANSLTFTCSTTPTSDIDVNIVCL